MVTEKKALRVGSERICQDRVGPVLKIPMGGGYDRMTISGGMGRCGKPCVPHMTVCPEHASKEALLMVIRDLMSKIMVDSAANTTAVVINEIIRVAASVASRQ